MALIKCSECNKEISDKASACPHCGCPISTVETLSQEKKAENKSKTSSKSQRKKLFFIVAIIGAIIVMLAILMLTHVICFHSYSEATVVEPQTCYRCGKIIGDPKPLSEIEFPTKGLASLLPIPKSNMGEIEWDNSDSVYIYIGNFKEDDYNDYVKSCSEKGFDIDYQKGDDYYYADDINGNRLNLNYYKDRNIMAIQIMEPYKEDSDNKENNVDDNNTQTENQPSKDNSDSNSESTNNNNSNSNNNSFAYEGAVKVCQKIKNSLNNPNSLQIHEVLHITYNGCDYYYIDLSAMNRMGGYTRTTYYAMFMDSVLFKLEEIESFSYEDIINSKFDDLEYLDTSTIESRLK